MPSAWGVAFLLVACAGCTAGAVALWLRHRAGLRGASREATAAEFQPLGAFSADDAEGGAATRTQLPRGAEIRHSVIAAILLGAINSYNTTIVGGLARPIIRAFYPDGEDGQESLEGLLVACILFGGLGGALLAPALADKIGRPGAVTVCGLCATFFPVLLAVFATTSFGWVVVLRTCVGVAIGMSAVLGPLYIAERAPLDIRGKLGTVYQVAVCTFVLFAELVNFWANPESADDIPPELIQLQFGLFALVGVAIVVYSLFYMPDVAGAGALPQQNGGDDGHSDSGESLIEALKSIETRWWVLIVVLPATQQLTGINAVVLYAPQIFKFSFSDYLLVTFLCVGTWNLFSVFVSFALIERLGRRKLMLAGLAGMAVSLLVLGIVFAELPLGHEHMGVMTLLGVMGFIFAFEIGPGPLFFVMASESFPPRIKSNAIALSNAGTWIYNIFVVFSFPPLSRAFGNPAVAKEGDHLPGTAVLFVAFSVVSAGCLWVVWRRVPQDVDDAGDGNANGGVRAAEVIQDL